MLGVGTTGFLVDFLLFNVLLGFGAPPNLANLVALLVSSGLVFGVNLGWTYSHRDVPLPHHSAARFAAVQLGSVAIIAAGVAVVTGLTSSVLAWNLAKFLLTIGVGFGRFYLYREWVYSDRGHRPNRKETAAVASRSVFRRVGRDRPSRSGADAGAKRPTQCRVVSSALEWNGVVWAVCRCGWKGDVRDWPGHDSDAQGTVKPEGARTSDPETG